MKTYYELANELIENQVKNWQLAQKNYTDLSKVQIKEIPFGNFTIKIQYNPARIISSAAKVDKQSIEKRACFLCVENRPIEQESIAILNQYFLLINPFPIFPKHLTIVSTQHIDQQIKNNIESMLQLSLMLEGFTIFYNGPKSGASAPDHFHFQAGNTGFMPLDNELKYLIKDFGSLIIENETNIWAVEDGLRKMIVFEGQNAIEIANNFNFAYKILQEVMSNGEEPPMNLLCNYQKGRFSMVLFLRGAHRPWQYFAEGEQNILLSPASVDFGGTLITPLEKDFNKLDKKIITDIFRQTSVKGEVFRDIINKIKQLK